MIFGILSANALNVELSASVLLILIFTKRSFSLENCFVKIASKTGF